MTPTPSQIESAKKLYAKLIGPSMRLIDADYAQIDLITDFLSERDQQISEQAVKPWREAALTVIRDTYCLASQLPGFKGDCNYDGEPGDGPCDSCLAAARIDGTFKSLLQSPAAQGEKRG